jgi:GNAT superfamily N-acetyltransferase
LRRTKHFLWHVVDQRVLALDLASYRPPKTMAQTPIDVAESEEPLREIDQVAPSFSGTAERFVAAGFRPLVCCVGGEPAGYVFVHDDTVPQPHPSLDRFGLRLRPGEVYLFNLFVHPDHRKGGVAAGFFATTLQRLRDQGFRRAYGFVEAGNVPASWMYTAHGWQTMDCFKGTAILNAMIVSNRGVLLSTRLLGGLIRHKGRIVPEFVPWRLALPKQPPAY